MLNLFASSLRWPRVLVGGLRINKSCSFYGIENKYWCFCSNTCRCRVPMLSWCRVQILCMPLVPLIKGRYFCSAAGNQRSDQSGSLEADHYTLLACQPITKLEVSYDLLPGLLNAIPLVTCGRGGQREVFTYCLKSSRSEKYLPISRSAGVKGGIRTFAKCLMLAPIRGLGQSLFSTSPWFGCICF